MTKHALLIGIRLLFGILTLAAIAAQLAVQIRLGLSAVNFFSFFTNLSNLLAAFVLLRGAVQLTRGTIPTARDDLLRTTAAAYMAVVGIVFGLLLRDVDLGSLLPWVNAVLHYIMPVVVVAEWLIQPPRTALDAHDLVTMLIFPFVYLVYVLVRGALVNWYPYPFLSPAVAGGYGTVAVYVVGIAALFVVVGWTLSRIGSRLNSVRA